MSDEDAEEVVARAHQARGRGAVPRPTQRTAPLSERGSRSRTQATRALRQSCAQEPIARQLAQPQCWQLVQHQLPQLCNHCACERQLQQQTKGFRMSPAMVARKAAALWINGVEKGGAALFKALHAATTGGGRKPAGLRRAVGGSEDRAHPLPHRLRRLWPPICDQPHHCTLPWKKAGGGKS